MEATTDTFNQGSFPPAQLQLLLFVDNRSSSQEQMWQVRRTLETLSDPQTFQLEVMNVTEQPHLTEHFKLIATPALIRLYPTPQQILAGTNLATQLENWWPRWQQILEEEHHALHRDRSGVPLPSSPLSINSSSELLRLSDEIFQLQQDKVDLESQIRFKDRIIAMLAHDLRNPLTAALLAIDTAGLGFSSEDHHKACLSPEMGQQMLQQAKNQLREIDRMVTDILQAERGSNHSLVVQPDRLQLQPLCQEVIQQLQEQISHKNQGISMDIPSDLPMVYADRERIRQVLTNLLDNAIKYTPQGGSIQISMLHRTSQKVQVSICDTGPGIPPEKHSKIFEASFRLQRDEQSDGYGLGLSVCQRIIQSHYGQIWVSSPSPSGSCFHFNLPVYPYAT
ncbi:histidine kinase [Prochlorothrix hollandica]|uniref:Adaptive-response sensory-kinase SasA n=2 Tax=Prochlorothrix hollandica TaxID=1223 RepID=A0A0M2Q0K7_PROHO|nr:histidine kinase [Prochlorothrix hollandica]KKJ00828.1 histidine kinase [Prochlorothrix hollandica PCC 9006 = CALU 1027]